MLYYDYNTEQKFFQIKKALFGHYFYQKERGSRLCEEYLAESRTAAICTKKKGKSGLYERLGCAALCRLTNCFVR
jgi:hypothetical protein